MRVWTRGSGVVTAFDKDREVPVKKAPGNHLSHTIPGSGDQKVSATISQDTVPFTVVSAIHDGSLRAIEVPELLQYSIMADFISLFMLVLLMMIHYAKGRPEGLVTEQWSSKPNQACTVSAARTEDIIMRLTCTHTLRHARLDLHVQSTDYTAKHTALPDG